MLTMAGFHVPAIPFVDILGKFGIISSSAQTVSVVPKLNVGVIFSVTVTVKTMGDAHPPPGVKV